jgi:hypothetical protein
VACCAAAVTRVVMGAFWGFSVILGMKSHTSHCAVYRTQLALIRVYGPRSKWVHQPLS